MKLQELFNRLKYILEDSPETGEKNVVVKTANEGIPCAHMSQVTNAHSGFDWTDSFFIIETKDKLVVENKIEDPDLREYARKRLELLKERHNKLGFKYIAKVREEEWIDGFVEALHQHITGVK